MLPARRRVPQPTARAAASTCAAGRPGSAWGRVALLGGALLATALAGSRARAAAPPAALRLEWSAPAGCPGAREVRELTVGVLGRPISSEGKATTWVRAQVRATPAGYTLTIETRSRGGTDLRHLSDRRCSVLAEAAAVIAAAAVEAAVATPPSSEPGRGPAPPPVSAARPSAPPSIVPPPPGGELPPGTGDPGPGAAPGAGGADGGLSPGTGGTGLSPGTGGSGTELSPGTGGSGTELSPGTGGTGPGVSAPPVPTFTANAGAAGPDDPARALAPAPGAAPLRDAEGPRPPASLPTPADPTGAATDTSSRRRRVRFGVRADAMLDLGSVPAVTGGLALTGSVFGRLWRAELHGLWLAPRTVVPDPAIELGARVGLLAAGARGCVVPRVRRLEIPACAGLEAGVLRGQGVGDALGRPGADALPWVAASLGPGLAWVPLPRVALTLRADLVVPLTDRRFSVRGFGDVYEGEPVAGRASLGVELRFR